MYKRPITEFSRSLAGLCVLTWAATAALAPGQTNNATETSHYVDVFIYNAPRTAGQTNTVAVTLYDIVGMASAPDQRRIVASEREFRLSAYNTVGDQRVTLPHAVQQPRERIFDRESDDDAFGFNIPGQDTTWETVSNEEWGWLSRDVERYTEDRMNMRRMGETALRESLMIQSLGLGSPGQGASGRLPGMNPLLTQPRDIRAGEQSRNLLDRELIPYSP